jgi:hypothetical protein
MVLITRPVVSSSVSGIIDISSAIGNNDFSDPAFSDNSFGNGNLTGWTVQLNSDTPSSSPVRARGISAYGDPGYNDTALASNIGYQIRASQSQYWLSQNSTNGDVLRLYRNITVTSGYSEIRLLVDAAGRIGSYFTTQLLRLKLNGTERLSTTVSQGLNFRFSSAWFSPPSGSVELEIATVRTASSDSTIFVHGIRMEGRNP